MSRLTSPVGPDWHSGHGQRAPNLVSPQWKHRAWVIPRPPRRCPVERFPFAEYWTTRSPRRFPVADHLVGHGWFLDSRRSADPGLSDLAEVVRMGVRAGEVIGFEALDRDG